VKERIATLHELETTYSLDDCIKLNAVLDMQNDVERMATEDAEKKGGR